MEDNRSAWVAPHSVNIPDNFPSAVRQYGNHFLDSLLCILNILASGNRDSGVVETYIPDTETAFDWLNYHL